MTHRGWLLGVLLLLVSASFAGCLGGDDDDPEPSDSTDTGDTGSGDDGNSTADHDTGGGDDVSGNVSASAPVAAITVDGNTTVAPEEEVTFDASATTDNDTAIENLTFSWDFGDGETAEGLNATHAYLEEGNFTVNLTVTDPDGNTGTANVTIVVAGGFSDVEVAVLEGSITAPNPVVHNAAVAYGSAGAACGGTMFACYNTVGGVEGTHFVLHEVEIPAGAAAIVLESSISATATLSIAVFDADGARIGASSVGASTAAPKVVLTDPAAFGTGFTVFVNSPLLPLVNYTITVTALAEAP